MTISISKTGKVAVALIFAVAFVLLTSRLTFAQEQPEVAVKKVFVCKYVGTPGVDERLQTGQNPISVSVNAIKDYDGVGSFFNDKQGRSLVVSEDNGQDEPTCLVTVDPEDPTDPVNPEEPVDPVDSTDPEDPTDPVNPEELVEEDTPSVLADSDEKQVVATPVGAADAGGVGTTALIGLVGSTAAVSLGAVIRRFSL